MNITFANGTTTQKAWVTETMARSAFDWDRCTSTVTITFGDPDPVPGDDFHVFAHTDIPNLPEDTCGRPDTAHMLIRPDLPDFLATFPGLAGRRHSDPIYGAYDIVHHELMHVVASKFTVAQVTNMTQILGAPTWETADSSAWYDSGSEAWAETGKDVFLGGDRMWDNRTKHRLSEQRLEDFFAVLDEVCPCEGGGDGGIG